MCPVCAANAALAVTSVTSTGGVTALAFRIFHWKRNAKALQPKRQIQRRGEHGYTGEQERVSESRIAY